MAHKHSFPIKGIEALIKLAQINNLQSLQVDGIVIVPRPRIATQIPKAREQITVPGLDGKQRSLTPREYEEVGLFGLAGMLGELPDSLTDFADQNGEPEIDEQ